MQGEPVVRIRVGESPGLDRYNNPVPGVGAEVPVGDALFDPGGSREPVEVGRAATVTTPKLYFRGHWPDIRSTDRLCVRGDVYQVQGRPASWRNGGVIGMTVELELVEG